MRFFDLQQFQVTHRKWLAHNFPNQKPHDALLGLIEEVGELAHAHLKSEQGIRGDAKEHRKAGMDAIGDILIYLTSYCNTNGYDLEACLMLAWEEVEQRDWQTYPRTGTPDAEERTPFTGRDTPTTGDAPPAPPGTGDTRDPYKVGGTD